jgi:hypothetical protein
MLTDFLAGLICGLAMGTVFLGVGVAFVMRNRDIYHRLDEALPQGLSPTMVMLGYVLAMPLLWGAIGGVAGILYSVIADSYPDGGLGSPNLVFTAAALGIALLVLLVLLVARRRIVKAGLPVIVAFAIVFGWILPLLGDWR